MVLRIATPRVTLRIATSSATPCSLQPITIVAFQVRVQMVHKSVQSVRNLARHNKNRGCALKVPWISSQKTTVNQYRAQATQVGQSLPKPRVEHNSCTLLVWVVLVTLVPATLRIKWVTQILGESCRTAVRWAARSIAGQLPQAARQPNTGATLLQNLSGRPPAWGCPNRTTSWAVVRV